MVVTPPRFANKHDFRSLGLHLQHPISHGFWPPRMTPSATYEPIPVAVNDCRPQLDTTEDKNIQAICEQLAGKVDSFLESDAPTPLLRRVQTQTRSALAVIVKALEVALRTASKKFPSPTMRQRLSRTARLIFECPRANCCSHEVPHLADRAALSLCYRTTSL
ncbi:Flavin adenine dinucleotide synthetase [Blumeria graminis f. sp. tritici 96224]|uniref:Flavin adenine dinucleotide synthetase n=1 Tax=Blumeria graminis f. sp. tritici 96224 TaxID=1268274 RepID=A0A656KJZ3_BLUGR|nr:Flavin adenine dinucleotide synthetase [Blumeria graminis f. sp. tritici 96224]